MTDRTPGNGLDKGGLVTNRLQNESPGPEKESNWLPTPDGPFALSLCIYWPEQEILNDEWEPSAPKKA